MILISKIHIEGFRSIRSAELRDLGHLTALAGLNNSGKSNVLRALNAFFNGETDPDRYVDVDDDYYRPDLKRKKRKRIRIAITFSLPDRFTFRRGLEPVRDLLKDRTFTVTKEWTRDKLLPSYWLNNAPLGLEDQQKIEQFLSLIKFRYIPNRVLPTDVIRAEHQALRDVLVRRLARRAKRDEAAFLAIRETSERMIVSLARRFAESCPGQGKVRLATPTSWQDMAFTFGYRLIEGDIEIEDIAQGAGIQSLLMLETLYLIDRDYFQQFGWRQAAIWAVEEPESSLHSSLEARVASYLATISRDEKSRLQVFCTTHSDLVIQYADKSVVAERHGGESRFSTERNVRRAIDRLARAGVSRWVHPLLFYPLDPVVFVEGKYDAQYFEEALRFIRPSRPVHVTFLEQLEVEGTTGGLDAMRRYLKAHANVIRARPKDAPVVIILDWDAASKRRSFQNLVRDSARYKVLVWPEGALNPRLGRSFRGIERAYSDRIIEEGIEAGAAIGTTREGKRIVESGCYGQVKKKLAEVVAKGLQAEDLEHARPFVEQVLKKARAKG